MSAIRPKGKLKDARFLRAGRPATMNFAVYGEQQIQEQLNEQPPPEDPEQPEQQGQQGQGQQGQQGQPPPPPEEAPEQEVPRQREEVAPEVEFEEGERLVEMKGTPYKLVEGSGRKVPN